jgi:hypothetical protein
MRARHGAGAATVDYLGAVLAVGVLMLALVAVREHRPERRPPIDPVAHLAAPLRTVTIPHPRAAPRTRPVRPRPRRPPRPRATVIAPVWAVGW